MRVTVIFEGDGLLTGSFKQLINKLCPNANVKVETGKDLDNTIKLMVKKGYDAAVTDSDEIQEENKKNIDLKRQKLIKKYGIDKNQVLFFMVSKMESWFISQPSIVEQILPEKDTTNLSYLRNSFKKEQAPDTLISEILNKADPKKKRKYDKVADGAQLIAKLDTTQLQKDFDEVRALAEYLQKHAT